MRALPSLTRTEGRREGTGTGDTGPDLDDRTGAGYFQAFPRSYALSAGSGPACGLLTTGDILFVY